MSTPIDPSAAKCLIAVPTLNEAKHIARLLEQLLVEAKAMNWPIVVIDGGSTDGTPAIVESFAARGEPVRLAHNPKRIQSAAMNQAVAQFGDGMDYVIRIDAHGDYPPDYCRVLVQDARDSGGDCVVVPMVTVGQNTFQRAVATAQNSMVGTGGSAHRTGKGGAWVDHGHHALMSIPAYREVGGYDETFRHNEDAELDHRLRLAGYRIWLTAATSMTYYPRSTPSGLFKQYFGYGRGRARNVLKHRVVPRIRQMLPLAILPAVALAALSFVHWGALVPLVAWVALCVTMGFVATRQHFSDYGLPMSGAPLVGLAAMIMHLAWSSGFWLHLAQAATSGLGARRA